MPKELGDDDASRRSISVSVSAMAAEERRWARSPMDDIPDIRKGVAGKLD